MEITEAIERHILQLKADGRAVSTLAQRRRHLELFARWWHDVQPTGDLAGLTHERLAEFFSGPVARLREDGTQRHASTQNTMRASIRIFASFLHRAGYVAEDAGRVIRRAVVGRPPPRSMSPKEQEQLLAVLDSAETPTGERDAVLFRTMLRTGLRLASALGLRVEDLDFERGEMRLRAAKGNREQVALMPADISERLRVYVGDRSEGIVFASAKGEPLSHRHVQRRLTIWLERAGVKRPFAPHALRHSFGMALYEKTGDVLLVKTALGHRSIQSTLAYVRPSEDRLREALA